jgi:hypothetical protein
VVPGVVMMSGVVAGRCDGAGRKVPGVVIGAGRCAVVAGSGTG